MFAELAAAAADPAKTERMMVEHLAPGELFLRAEARRTYEGKVLLVISRAQGRLAPPSFPCVCDKEMVLSYVDKAFAGHMTTGGGPPKGTAERELLKALKAAEGGAATAPEALPAGNAVGAPPAIEEGVDVPM
mmetsp:Transcript_103273/g.236607  ORF Transcript_103273/g.236607 Transcript_103273/m.236607 type:complete len:133 (-) Transcript_103273:90-488(-)